MSQTMSQEAPKPSRTRRTLNERLDIGRTHLVRRRGPVMAVCIHLRHGLFMGMSYEPRALWSHEPWSMDRLRLHHPDALRTAVSWPDAVTAKADLLRWLSYDDWSEVAIKPLTADVSESPQVDADPMAGPVMLCSVENGIRLLPHLHLDDRHRLAADMLAL